ncbi:MAG: lipid asymmetry maintenance protein MlaB [Isosphaeraceae bacterium]
MTVESKEPQTVVLSGPVTLYEVLVVRETLQAAIALGKRLRIDLSDSGPWDLAGFQLLISGAKSAESRGRNVVLLNTPQGCVDIAERAGLSGWLAAHQS